MRIYKGTLDITVEEERRRLKDLGMPDTELDFYMALRAGTTKGDVVHGETDIWPRKKCGTTSGSIETREISGALVGGSLIGNEFEIRVDGEIIAGTVDDDGLDALVGLALGDIVDARVEVSRAAGEQTDTEEAYRLIAVRKSEKQATKRPVRSKLRSTSPT